LTGPASAGPNAARYVHWYEAQTPACHRTHLRTARRVWRTVVRATHTPFTRVLPGPQPIATRVTISSTWGCDAGIMACADVATNKAKPATATDLSILFSLSCPINRNKPTEAALSRRSPIQRLTGRRASGRLRA
jgi:hypothetical protein